MTNLASDHLTVNDSGAGIANVAALQSVINLENFHFDVPGVYYFQFQSPSPRRILIGPTSGLLISAVDGVELRTVIPSAFSQGDPASLFQTYSNDSQASNDYHVTFKGLKIRPEFAYVDGAPNFYGIGVIGASDGRGVKFGHVETLNCDIKGYVTAVTSTVAHPGGFLLTINQSELEGRDALDVFGQNNGDYQVNILDSLLWTKSVKDGHGHALYAHNHINIYGKGSHFLEQSSAFRGNGLIQHQSTGIEVEGAGLVLFEDCLLDGSEGGFYGSEGSDNVKFMGGSIRAAQGIQMAGHSIQVEGVRFFDCENAISYNASGPTAPYMANISECEFHDVQTALVASGMASQWLFKRNLVIGGRKSGSGLVVIYSTPKMSDISENVFILQPPDVGNAIQYAVRAEFAHYNGFRNTYNGKTFYGATLRASGYEIGANEVNWSSKTGKPAHEGAKVLG